MAFASARRDWARYRRGECDLISALSYFAFGCVTVIVALMAVLEAATFLFDWPTQARQYAGQIAGAILLWAEVALWRIIDRRMGRPKVKPGPF